MKILIMKKKLKNLKNRIKIKFKMKIILIIVKWNKKLVRIFLEKNILSQMQKKMAILFIE